MDDDNMQNIGQVSPEEAMRQLVELRLQVGESRFRTLAGQMGMPGDLLDYVEQVAAQVETSRAGTAGDSGVASGAGRAAGGSGLLDASGRPIGGGSSGLVDASGRPIGGFAAQEEEVPVLNGEDEDDEITLNEEESRQLFQELVGVRMIVGQENFATLADQMGMPQEASDMVETAAGQIEDEISTRYDDQDEAMTVRLVNARMMMGQERFGDLAGQVGMPQEVIDDVENIATQIEAEGMAADGETQALND